MPAGAGRVSSRISHKIHILFLDKTGNMVYDTDCKRLQNVFRCRKRVKKVVTLKDISNACGLSVATVSRALNGLSEVRQETAERIRTLAQDMGYHPNAAARALKTNRSYDIGILYENRMHHEFFSVMIDTLRTAAQQSGYDLTFLSRPADADGSGSDYLQHARCRGLDGVVIVQADFESPEVVSLVRSDLPCVAIDYDFPGCDCVLAENRGSMADLVQRAFDLGHRRIAFVHGEQGFVTRNRLEGFRQGCRAAGLAEEDCLLYPARFHDPEASAEATRALLSLPQPPTCILYPDDVSCLGALAEIKAMRRRVPEDVCIAGYDGILLAEVLEPRLTTYLQDADGIGRAAMALLTDAIAGGDAHKPRHVTVPGRLIPGGTLTER